MTVKLWLQRACFALLVPVLVAGCAGLSSASPQALPTLILDGTGSPAQANPAPADNTAATGSQVSGAVIASGIVVPSDQADVTSALSGSVQSLEVALGSSVEAGQVLVRLAGSENLTAAASAANFELLSAQQALADLKANAAQARAQAQLRLAQAGEVFEKAEQRRGWKEYRIGDDNQINVARADLIVANDTLHQAESVYGGQADNPDDNLNKAAALSALSAARQARDRALANLNYLLSLPNDTAVAKADAELEVARAELDAAQSDFDQLKDSPDPSAMALAEARVANAEAQLQAAKSSLTELEIKAPLAGVVTALNIHSGAWVLPGQPLLSLADLDPLRVETTDLSERDVPAVAIGQPVTVSIKAINASAAGHVIAISPLANSLGGDVVYTTTIELDTFPAALRAGMSVEVSFE